MFNPTLFSLSLISLADRISFLENARFVPKTSFSASRKGFSLDCCRPLFPEVFASRVDKGFLQDLRVVG
jgi:hypothetical protein